MPEAILIVDGTATNRKLTHRVLTSAGYEVRSVADAAAALVAIPQFQPKMILTDLQLDGMDGIAFTKRIKDDPQTRQTLVIAVTGCGTEEDRDAALNAGCDDFILKPIDTRALPVVVRAHLNRQEQDAISVEAASAADLPSWALELCNEFLQDGAAKARSLLDSQAAPEEVKRSAHMWAGLGGTFGFPEITKVARQLEELLRNPAVRSAEVDKLLERLEALFSRAAASSVHAQTASPLPSTLLQSFSGKTFALVGFESHETARLTRALEAASVQVTSPAVPIAESDLIIAAAESEETAAILQQTRGAGAQPLLLVGTRRNGPQVEMMLDSASFDFAATPWTVDEIFARAYRLLAGRQTSRPTSQTPDRDRKIRLVLADDDPTVLTLLRTTMESYGMECAVASEGDKALELMRANPPDAAILDIIMPNMDGLEVLAAIRNDPLLKNVRVLLVSALQQESDIVRALGLGADDYVTKPFSPVEVVARLKRLVRSEF